MKSLSFSLNLGIRTDYLMQQQALTGVRFDTEKARKLYDRIKDMMEEIEKEVEPKLPERPLSKAEILKHTPVKEQFKGDGTPNSFVYRKFPSIRREENLDKNGETLYFYYGIVEGKEYKLPHNEPLKTKGEMKLSNQRDLKNWLLSQGWKPTLWNFKKDKKNKFIRPLEKTSPKFHDKGVLCPNLELLSDVVQLVKPVVTWLSLRNRKSSILNPEKKTGWLSHPRLKIDNRLPSESSGVTNTLRQKHSVVANIPRLKSLLGKEMRSLFCAPDGKVLVGWDASGLEARVEAHWCYKYRGGVEYAEMLISGNSEEGTDIHTRNSKIFGVSRSLAKNGKYCLSYGGQANKLAETLNVSKERGEELFNDFWKDNTALKEFKGALTAYWRGEGSHKIVCNCTGSVLYSRSEHSLVNLVFQHTGAIIMDLSGVFMDKWLGGLKEGKDGLPCYVYKGYEIKRILYYHDEYQFECDKEIAKEIGEMGVKSIIKAGQYLELNVPLDAEYDIGASWAETH